MKPRVLGPVRDQGGFALESAIFTMVIATAVMAVLLSAAITTLRTASMEVGNTRVNYAAEAGAESAIAQLMVAVEDGYLSDDDLSTLSPPSLTGFTFDSFSVTRVGGVVVEPITDGTFAGLSALTQQVDIYTEAKDPSGNSAASIVTAKAQAIPIFQFGVFYDQDLEITNAPLMTFDGWVHTNANLYLNSNNAYYKDQVTATGGVYRDHKYKHAVRTGIYIADATGSDVYMDFDSRTDPLPDDFRAKSESYFDSRLRTAAHGVDTLRLPLPVGMPPEEIVAPRIGTDGTLERNTKWAWKADLYAVVDLDHSSIHNTTNQCAAITFTRPAGLSSPTNTECNTFFSFDWEQFVEGREDRMIDVLNLDVDKMYDWVATNPTNNAVSLLYVEFVGDGLASAGADGTVFEVLRVTNASTLDDPLTIATGWPMYTLGDFNSVGWQPAALVADVITFLSNAWSDAANAGPTWSAMQNASNTTVFAAVMAGHSAAPCDHEVAPCASVVQSGGAFENFPRHLEKWSGVTFQYRGSIVSLFNPVHALMPWYHRVYYAPPIRDWLYDTRFRDPANLPPGTPVVGNVLQTAYRPVH